jgi:hypothetical protein
MNSESISELVTALVAAQAEFSAVPKGSVNPFFKSTYAALPDVVATAGPVLAKHGLAVSQFVSDNDTLTTYLLHTSGQFMSHTMNLHLLKQDPQSAGSAITYARRQSYMACLGLVADTDDDGNLASAPSQQSAPSLSQKVATAASAPRASGGSSRAVTENQTKAIWAITHKGLGWDDLQMYDKIEELTSRKVGSLEELSMDDAKLIIESLKALQDA